MRAFLLLSLILLGTGLCQLKAQGSVDSLYLLQLEQVMDSIERVNRVVEEVHQYEQKLLAEEMRFHPNDGTLLLRGLIQTATNHSFIDHDGVFPRRNFEWPDYTVASLPLAATWALKAMGVESRSRTRRMLTANGLAILIAGGTVKGLKLAVHEQRPNGKDNQSCPSGHTALAFTSAAILEREFGHISPWITVGGYTTATATEWLRLRHHAHYVNDIFAGAGIGLVATNLAYFITDRFFGEREINPPRLYKGDLVRLGRFLDRPVSISLHAGSELTSRHIRQDGTNFCASSTYSAGLQYSYFMDSHWAVDADVRLSSTQLKTDLGSATVRDEDIQGNVLTQYHLLLGLRYSIPLGLNVRLAGRLFGGEVYTMQTDFRYRITDNALPGIHDGELFLRIPHRWNPEAGGGLSVEFITTKNYVTGFSVDYLHSFSHIFPNRCLISSYWKILL